MRPAGLRCLRGADRRRRPASTPTNGTRRACSPTTRPRASGRMPAAWADWERRPPSYRKNATYWVTSAKRRRHQGATPRGAHRRLGRRPQAERPLTPPGEAMRRDRSPRRSTRPIAALHGARPRRRLRTAGGRGDRRGPGCIDWCVPEPPMAGWAARWPRRPRSCWRSAAIDGSTALGFAMQVHVVRGAARRPGRGRRAPRARLVRAVVDDGALVNNAATEEGGGSPARGAIPGTVAEPEPPATWRLTGEKTWTTWLPVLRLAPSSRPGWARTNRPSSGACSSTWIGPGVERLAGLRGARDARLGVRPAASLDDAVPADALVAERRRRRARSSADPHRAPGSGRRWPRPISGSARAPGPRSPAGRSTAGRATARRAVADVPSVQAAAGPARCRACAPPGSWSSTSRGAGTRRSRRTIRPGWPPRPRTCPGQAGRDAGRGQRHGRGAAHRGRPGLPAPVVWSEPSATPVPASSTRPSRTSPYRPSPGSSSAARARRNPAREPGHVSPTDQGARLVPK